MCKELYVKAFDIINEKDATLSFITSFDDFPDAQVDMKIGDVQIFSNCVEYTKNIHEAAMILGHELGHIHFEHSIYTTKSRKEKELEADHYGMLLCIKHGFDIIKGLDFDIRCERDFGNRLDWNVMTRPAFKVQRAKAMLNRREDHENTNAVAVASRIALCRWGGADTSL